MLILGIDTSDIHCTLGLSEDRNIIGEISLNMKNSHLKTLIPALDNLLEKTQLSIKDIDLYSVISGPGSWTGIRIGITTAKNLAFSLNRPIISMCSLDVLAYGFRYTGIPVYPVIDASRRRVYLGGYDCSGPVPVCFTGYKTLDINDFLDGLKKECILLGNGAVKYKKEITARRNIKIAPPSLNSIKGGFTAEAGLNNFEKNGPEDCLSLSPLYLQESSAERNNP